MKDAAIAIFSAIIGFLLSRWQSSFDRKRSARDVFRAATADQRAKLDELRTSPDEFFRQSISILRVAVYHVRPFAKDWAGLEKAWREYESADPKRFTGMQGALNTVRLEGIPDSQQDLRDSYERLRDHLDTFDNRVA